jgi:hypothetical protein
MNKSIVCQKIILIKLTIMLLKVVVRRISVPVVEQFSTKVWSLGMSGTRPMRHTCPLARSMSSESR